MRRLVILLTLLVILWAVYRLNRLASGWHYIIPAPPGELLYATSFDGAADDWEQDESHRMSSQINAGAMRIAVHADGEGLYSAADPYFRDFDIQLQAQVREGVFDRQNTNAYGIIFRQQDRNNYYVFLVNSDGAYRIKRVVNGSPLFLSDWITNAAINTEIGAANQLRVVGQGDRFQFYINDILLSLCIPNHADAQSTVFNDECLEGTMQETLTDGSIPFGRLGVYVELARGQTIPVIVDFDNVVVYGPQPISGAAP